MDNIDFGIFFFNSDDGGILGDYALHAKNAVRERAAERYPNVCDDGWHVLSGDLFGPRKIHIILTSLVALPDVSRLDSDLQECFAAGKMPAFVPYLIGVFMCPLAALRHADARLKQDGVAGYLGLATFVLPSENVLREISECLSLPMNPFNSA